MITTWKRAGGHQLRHSFAILMVSWQVLFPICNENGKDSLLFGFPSYS